MKKIIAILFLSIYMLSTPQLIEFMKLPFLIEHYNEHKLHDTSMSLVGFLYLHYAAKSNHATESDQQSKLPFKSVCNVNAPFLCNVTEAVFFKLKPVFDNLKNNKTATYSPINYTSHYLSSIWQPPRFC